MILLCTHTEVFLLKDLHLMNSSGLMLCGKWETITFLTSFQSYQDINLIKLSTDTLHISHTLLN